ncbi:MAG: hypothetical protein U1F49_22090, partial [Rubrivivax sp.]
MGFAALGIVTLLLVALAACEALEWPFLRSPLEHTLAKALGRPVTLAEPFGVRLLGPVRVHAGEIVIGAAPGENDGHEDGGNGHGGNAGTRAAAARGGAPAHLLRASEASLVVPQATLWHLRGRKAGQPVYIESLDVAKIDLHLRRNAQGRTNWAFGALASSPAAAAASEADAARAHEAAASQLVAEQHEAA